MADYNINKWDDQDYLLKDSNNHVILLPYPFINFGYMKNYLVSRYPSSSYGWQYQYEPNKFYIAVDRTKSQRGYLIFENEAAAKSYVNKHSSKLQYSRGRNDDQQIPDEDHEYLIRPLQGWNNVDIGGGNLKYAGSYHYDYFWTNVAKEFVIDPDKPDYLSFGNCFITPYHNGGYSKNFGLILSDPNNSGYPFIYNPNNLNTRLDIVTFPSLSLTCAKSDNGMYHKTFSRYYKDSNVFVGFTHVTVYSPTTGYSGQLRAAFCVINFLRNGNKFQLIIQDRSTVYVRDTVNKSIYKTDGLSELFDFKSVSTFPITSGDPRYNAVTFKVQGSPKDYLLDSFNDSARFITLCAECGDSKGIIRPDSDKIKFLVLDENLDSTTKNTEILNSFADADSTAYKSGLILLLKGNEYHPPVVLQVPKEEWLNNENIS